MMTLDNELLLVFILGCALVAFTILGAIIGVKIYYHLNDRQRSIVLTSLHSQLVIYLSESGASAQTALLHIATIAQSRSNKNLLIEELLTLASHFSGLYAEKIYEIYEHLDLHKLSYQKLNSSSSHQKIKGIQELSSMEYKAAYHDLAKLINHKNQDVRRNARVAIVKIKKKQGLMDLCNLEGVMSQWTFINIANILKRSPIKLNQTELQLLQNSKNSYIQKLTTELEYIAYAN